MARYRTRIMTELMGHVRAGQLPDGVRLIREIEQCPEDPPTWTLVELDDDNAPAELDGREVMLMASCDGPADREGQPGQLLIHGCTAV